MKSPNLTRPVVLLLGLAILLSACTVPPPQVVVVTATPGPTQTPLVITATPARVQIQGNSAPTPVPPTEKPILTIGPVSIQTPVVIIVTPSLPPAPTKTVTATPTTPPIYAPPNLVDPPNKREFPAKNTILRWQSDHSLEADEVFELLVWPEGSDAQKSMWSTRENIYPINDLYAWNLGKYSWVVRIKRVGDGYLSDPSQPFTFRLIETSSSGGGAGGSSSSQPPPPPPPPPYP